MTEEIIIDCAFYKDGVCASPINKTCEYCKNIDVSKCYHKQLKRLEQENRALQAYKDINEDFKKAWDELNEKYKQLRSALEEIRKECKCYGRQRGSNRIFDREYGGELHINIIEQINEVLE